MSESTFRQGWMDTGGPVWITNKEFGIYTDKTSLRDSPMADDELSTSLKRSDTWLRFLQLVQNLPREIRDEIYRNILYEDESSLVCVALPAPPAANDEGSMRGGDMHISWHTLTALGGRTSVLAAELVQTLYSEQTIYLRQPYIGDFESFLNRDILFGTSIVPKQHLGALVLDYGGLYHPDREGNRWHNFAMAHLGSDNKSLAIPPHYRNMANIPDGIRLLQSLSRKEKVEITIQFRLEYRLDREWRWRTFVEQIKESVMGLKDVGIKVTVQKYEKNRSQTCYVYPKRVIDIETFRWQESERRPNLGYA